MAYQVNLGGLIGISASLLDRNHNITRTVVVVNDGKENLNPCWSSDGKKIIFQKKCYLSLGVNTFVDDDIYEVGFNPDLPQMPTPMIARPALNDLYAYWLPTMGDSVQNSIAKAFITSFQKIKPDARKDLN